MATSGTVGQTRFSFAKIIDLALRRCKLNPSVVLNAELVNTARAAMYLIMTSLANRGLNLWRVEHNFLGLLPGVNRYDLPAGTIQVPNLNFITNEAAAGTLSAVAGGYQFALTSAVTSSRIGFKPTSTFTGAVTLLSSTDGVAYTNQTVLASATYSAGTWYWFDLLVHESILGVRVTSPAAMVLAEVAVSSTLSAIPMWQWNRDEYSLQPNRTQPGRPSTNFYFDRQNPPQVWIWTVPNSTYDHIEYWVHREIQDISALTEEIDVPTRWLNAAVWMLAREFCAVVPNVPPEAVQLVMTESSGILVDAEAGESDGASIYYQPRVSGYTR